MYIHVQTCTYMYTNASLHVLYMGTRNVCGRLAYSGSHESTYVLAFMTVGWQGLFCAGRIRYSVMLGWCLAG